MTFSLDMYFHNYHFINLLGHVSSFVKSLTKDLSLTQDEVFGTNFRNCRCLISISNPSPKLENYFSAGLEIVTNTVAFATEFFPFSTKISGEVANLRLAFIFAFSKQKG